MYWNAYLWNVMVKKLVGKFSHTILSKPVKKFVIPNQSIFGIFGFWFNLKSTHKYASLDIHDKKTICRYVLYICIVQESIGEEHYTVLSNHQQLVISHLKDKLVQYIFIHSFIYMFMHSCSFFYTFHEWIHFFNH